MGNITKTLSKKTDINGFNQVLFFVRIGRKFQVRVKSGIFVPVKYWNKEKEGLSIPRKLMPSLLEELQGLREKLDVAEMRVLKLIDICGTTIDKTFIENTLTLLKDYDGVITEKVVNDYLHIEEEK